RGEPDERKAHCLGAGPDAVAQRELVPQADVLDQHNVAGLEVARGELVQVLLQLDEMIPDVETPVQRLDLGEALAQCLRLAVADDDDLAASQRMHLRSRDYRRCAGGRISQQRQVYRFDGEAGIAEMVQPDVERGI